MSSWTFKLYFNSVWVSIANLARLGHRVPWWPTWKSLARDSQQPDNRWLEVVFVFCLCSALLQASWNLKPEQVLSSGNLWVTLAIWIQVPVPILSIMMNMKSMKCKHAAAVASNARVQATTQMPMGPSHSFLKTHSLPLKPSGDTGTKWYWQHSALHAMRQSG